MVENEIDAVRTKPVGFAPILKHYFEKAGIAEIIDDNVELDPRRKVLSHGEACVAMITAILFHVLQLYRLCKFAEDTTILETILPGIDPKEYFYDRLADTLDAIHDYGLGNLEMAATKNMIDEFEVETDVCHNDTTTRSVYGDCDAGRKEDSVKITFEYSKKHRQDLKQFLWSLSVADDHAFPLFQQAYDGNTSDVDTYVEQSRRSSGQGGFSLRLRFEAGDVRKHGAHQRRRRFLSGPGPHVRNLQKRLRGGGREP